MRNGFEKCVLMWIPKIRVIRKSKGRPAGSYLACVELSARGWTCPSRAREERLCRNVRAGADRARPDGRFWRTLAVAGWRQEGGRRVNPELQCGADVGLDGSADAGVPHPASRIPAGTQVPAPSPLRLASPRVFPRPRSAWSAAPAG